MEVVRAPHDRRATDRAPDEATEPTPEADLDIDALAARSGQTIRNLRAYLQLGILHPGQKRGRSLWFDESHVRRLNSIAELQSKGYSLAAIRDVIDRETAPGHDLMLQLVQYLRSNPVSESNEVRGRDTEGFEAAIAPLVDYVKATRSERDTPTRWAAQLLLICSQLTEAHPSLAASPDEDDAAR